MLYALFFCSVDVFLLYSHSHINTQFKPLELGSDLKYMIIKYMFFLTVGISLVKWRNDMSHHSRWFFSFNLSNLRYIRFLENSSLSSWIFIRINFTPNYRSHFVKNWAPSTSRESSNYFTPFAISCCYSWAFAGNLKEKNKFLSIFLNFGFDWKMVRDDYSH